MHRKCRQARYPGFFLWIRPLVTARKRSLEQCNVFTLVHRGSLSGEGGSLCQEAISVRGVRRDTPIQWTSGWYASCWNAFFFSIAFAGVCRDLGRVISFLFIGYMNQTVIVLGGGHPPGTVARISCHPGYHSFGYRNSTTCQSSGNWTHDLLPFSCYNGRK